MNALMYILPAVILIAGIALAAFIWALRSGQYHDPAGAGVRILIGEDKPTDAARKVARIR